MKFLCWFVYNIVNVRFDFYSYFVGKELWLKFVYKKIII